MGLAGFREEISTLLASDRELTVKDFLDTFPGVPAATVHSRIRALLRDGELSQTGHGRYLAVHKPVYEIEVTAWMREVNEFLIKHCEGVNHCVSQHRENLILEVPRPEVSKVESCLKEHYSKVVHKKDAERFPAPLEGYIIVGPLVSGAPLASTSGIPVPSLEKELIDSLSKSGKDGLRDFQRALEVYPVNMNRMRRYAARRGVSEELDTVLSSLDPRRMETFSLVQKYFSQCQMVTKAWVYGSFARMEETAESDLDLLVDFDPERKVSLLDIVRQKLDLEKLLGREVDLIQNGSLKPFAVHSAERDKYLIYER